MLEMGADSPPQASLLCTLLILLPLILVPVSHQLCPPMDLVLQHVHKGCWS